MGWREVEYEVVPALDPRLLAVTDALRASHVNGGTVLRLYRPVDEVAFDGAWRTDLQGIEHWLRCFLEARSVREAVPELQIPITMPIVPKHTWYGGFEFEGAITHLLLTGGAYVRPDFGEETARQMSRGFVDAVAGNQRLQTMVFNAVCNFHSVTKEAKSNGRCPRLTFTQAATV